jgi:hypothetical protein
MSALAGVICMTPGARGSNLRFVKSQLMTRLSAIACFLIGDSLSQRMPV